MNKSTILKVRNLHITYGSGKNTKTAVKNVSFDINRGEIVGLVGESGSGKTTIGKAIAGITPIAGGNVFFDNKLIFGLAPNLKKDFAVILKTLNYLNNDCFLISQALTKVSTDGSVGPIKNIRFTINRADNVAETAFDFLTAFLSYLNEANIIDPNLAKTHEISFKHAIKTIENAITNVNAIKSNIALINHELFKDDTKKNINWGYLKNNIDGLIYEKNQDIFFDITVSRIACQLLKTLMINTIDFTKIVAKIKASSVLYPTKLQQYIADIITEAQQVYHETSKMETSFSTAITSIDDLDIPKQSTWYKEKKDIQMIFQDPTSSLNGHMTVRDIVAEGLNNYPSLYKTEENIAAVSKDFANERDADKIALEKEKELLADIKKDTPEYITAKKAYDAHCLQFKKNNILTDKKILDLTVANLLKKVGLLPEHLSRYPHEFSGGQRQRIGIARAIALKPSLIIADEPISALDMSIRSQVLNLFNKFKKEYNFGCIFVTHDLNAVKYIADRIVVIYRGTIVEIAPTDKIFAHPAHPYTRHLLNAMPKIGGQITDEKNDGIKYDYDKVHYDYYLDQPQYHEIGDEHVVYLNKRELNEKKRK